MRSFLLIFAVPLVCLSIPDRGFAGALLQSFQCTGVLRSVEIYEDETRENGRQIKQLYIDDSFGTDFVTRVQRGGYVQYRFDGDKEEIRYYASQDRLEFWENGVRVPDEVFSKCTARGEASKATGIVRQVAYRKYDCGNKTVIVSDASNGQLRLKTQFSDGTSSEDIMYVSKIDDDTERWISDESLRKEKSAWAMAQGSGFASYHARFHKSRDEIRFWSQGGGKQDPANMHTVCARRK